MITGQEHYQPFIHPEQPVDPSDALVFSGGSGYNQAQTYAYRNTWVRPVFLCRVHHHGLKHRFHFEFFEAEKSDGTPVSVEQLRGNGVFALQRWE